MDLIDLDKVYQQLRNIVKEHFGDNYKEIEHGALVISTQTRNHQPGNIRSDIDFAKDIPFDLKGKLLKALDELGYERKD